MKLLHCTLLLAAFLVAACGNDYELYPEPETEQYSLSRTGGDGPHHKFIAKRDKNSANIEKIAYTGSKISSRKTRDISGGQWQEMKRYIAVHQMWGDSYQDSKIPSPTFASRTIKFSNGLKKKTVTRNAQAKDYTSEDLEALLERLWEKGTKSAP